MANVRLVAHVAKRYHDRGIPPGDLIQEGFCALLVAIDRFDLVNETRLATYAIWWIRQAIQRAVAGGRLSGPAKPQAAPPARPRRRRWPAALTGIGTTRIDPPSPAFSPTIEQVFAATRPVLSLDAPSRRDDTTSIGEFLIPPDEEDSRADDAQSRWAI